MIITHKGKKVTGNTIKTIYLENSDYCPNLLASIIQLARTVIDKTHLSGNELSVYNPRFLIGQEMLNILQNKCLVENGFVIDNILYPFEINDNLTKISHKKNTFSSDIWFVLEEWN